MSFLLESNSNFLDEEEKRIPLTVAELSENISHLNPKSYVFIICRDGHMEHVFDVVEDEDTELEKTTFGG